jgi:hypothetical protein
VLIVEVADSSLQLDQREKASLYDLLPEKWSNRDVRIG